jgi:hypothetical protein
MYAASRCLSEDQNRPRWGFRLTGRLISYGHAMRPVHPHFPEGILHIDDGDVRGTNAPPTLRAADPSALPDRSDDNVSGGSSSQPKRCPSRQQGIVRRRGRFRSGPFRATEPSSSPYLSAPAGRTQCAVSHRFCRRRAPRAPANLQQVEQLPFARILAERDLPVEVLRGSGCKWSASRCGWVLGAGWELSRGDRRLRCICTWHAGEAHQSFQGVERTDLAVAREGLPAAGVRGRRPVME